MDPATHRRERISLFPLAAWLGLLAVLPAGRLARAETLTLQQGADGYGGCLTRTLWEPTEKKPPGAASDEVLYLRGNVAYRDQVQVEVDDEKNPGQKKTVTKETYRESGNRLLLRFEIPPALKDRKLCRARLEVFVPEVRNLRMINETLCREVLQPWTAEADWENAAKGSKWTAAGGTLDVATDYANGRPKGAVDSFEFWEYNGQWFPHKYGFLQCPAGGRWIDFNVTPLAEKWLANPAGNHGVALEPITQDDKRFVNRLSADIPSHAGADKARRPRLVLEFAPLDEPYLVGMTDGLRKYCDRSTRYRFLGPFTDRYELAMARNEFEPFQVLVCPIAGDLKGVTLETGDLAGPEGAKIPASDVTCNCQELVLMHPNGKTGDWYFHGKRFWIPDPLSHARAVDLPRHVSTPFWFTVRTRPQTKPGAYRGTVTVKPANAPPRSLQLTVKVWDYEIPRRWNFQTMGQTCWGYIWQCYPNRTKEDTLRLKKAYIDFLMDRRFMPTEQYASNLSPDLSDIPYCVAERGGNTIYLNGNFRLPDLPGAGSPEMKNLRARYEAEKDRLLADAGKGEQLAQLNKRYQADQAEAQKVRTDRAKRLQELQDKYDADKAALLTDAGKTAELKDLAKRHDAEKADLLARLRKAYEDGTAAALKALRDRYDAVVALDAKLRADGKLADAERLLDMSLVYIGDETSDWDLMRRKSDGIRLACPELMIMIGGSFPRKELDGIIDIYDPQIGGGSRTYSLSEEMTHLIAASQACGERFFWYDAAGPMLPHPNVQCEEPLIASRAVFWLTWKYGVTGFEYYCYNIWSHNLPDKDGKRWPDKPFTSWGWGDTNGDGMLFYPGPDGPFSSVRFENVRDGIEDWESHMVLADYVEALRERLKKQPEVKAKAEPLLAKADALLKVPDEVVRNMTEWTWEPQVLLKARSELGETIDAFARLVPEAEALTVQKARLERQVRRQRDMLKARVEAARKSAATRPAAEK